MNYSSSVKLHSYHSKIVTRTCWPSITAVIPSFQAFVYAFCMTYIGTACIGKQQNAFWLSTSIPSMRIHARYYWALHPEVRILTVY